MNPIQNVPVVNQKVNYDTFDEFHNLKGCHKALVVLAAIGTIFLTLGLALPFAIPALIGKFRKMEVAEKPELKKVDDAFRKALQKASNNEKEETGDLEGAGELDAMRASGELSNEELSFLIEESDKDRVIGSFWTDYEAVDKIIEDLKALKSEITPYIVFNKYEEFKKNQVAEKKKLDPKSEDNFIVTAEHKTLVIDQIEIILEKKNDPIQFPVKLKDLPEQGLVNRELNRFNTVGDGSCAFHALLGNPVNNVYSCDATDARKKFCDYLVKAFKEKNLPKNIQNVLDDYFLHPEDAPEEFIKSLKMPHPKTKKIVDFLEVYRKDYKKLSIEKQEERKQKFKESPRVFHAYLSYIKKNNVYLLQDELEAAAECFNKRVRLFQKGWGNDNLNLGEEVLNKDGAEEVCIYYTGQNGRMKKHFERAQVRQLPQVG